jgi:hypothetical protein
VDKLPQVAAHRVTHVVSLAAVTIIAVVALAFASAPWGVYLLVTGILGGTTAALVLFPQLGLEKHLFDYVMVRLVGRISPETSQVRPELSQGTEPQAITVGDRQPLERRRTAEYERNRGLFLGHYWRPSGQEEQKADIRIQLRDHPDPKGGPTPLEAGKVESVTYQLGPKFSEEAITKRNSGEHFALDFSAYGPLLCLAEVTFNDGTEPLYRAGISISPRTCRRKENPQKST